ncbi:MAG: dihydroorotate dehydrogenase electron transfer subunit [Candidatus Bathyarchaeota archaeon]|nr:dihydroorotate dehydrogenase electron transfer subunit [Candidatus Bathyarchaeota archaeon]
MQNIDMIRTVIVLDVHREAIDITTIYFKDETVRTSKPGQYVMVWVPGEDEVPMSISTIDKNGLSSITVRNVGPTTEILDSIQPGAKLGIRGPYGNGYMVEGKNPLIVAGGSGTASLLPLVQAFLKKGVRPMFILGGRSSDQLLFEDELTELLTENLVISTDDGSMGYNGYASGYAALLMAENEFDYVYTCGPELMMAKVFYEAEKKGLPIQASLERYIKCAVGLCGNCVVGPYRVCKDGPIFDTAMLTEVREELGVSRMDASGMKIRVSH